MNEHVERLSAFTTDPAGGNPAGVVIVPRLPAAGRMRQIAANVGYSETAFLTAVNPSRTDAWQVRYFSPEAEVDFCGHATIASGVALARRHGTGTYTLHSNVGPITVETREDDDGLLAQLTSVTPQVVTLQDADARWTTALRDELLARFGWTTADLHPDHPPALAFAGVWHPVLVLAEREVLAEMTYDFEALRALMQREGWTTAQLVCPTPDGFDARDPFPVGGVVEDPATGAAAAALGGYLRAIGVIQAPTQITVVQGEDMGRRSVLRVAIPEAGGISVAGHAVAIDG